MRNSDLWKLYSLGISLLFFFMILYMQFQRDIYESDIKRRLLLDDDNDDIRNSRRMLGNDEKLIFVGGVPRSGTTLMRAMLDSHKDIRCGGETSIVPTFLSFISNWMDIKSQSLIEQNGVTKQVLDAAASAFIIEIISKHGPLAPRLCNKDPYTALHLPKLHRMFPNAKFILMIRDARAIIHSMIERHVPVLGWDPSNPAQMFSKWNKEIKKMVDLCDAQRNNCLMVYYERLVQMPEAEMRRILIFLDVPWSEDVLHHDREIGKEVALSPHEFSASQVKQKLYLDSLTAWHGCYADDILERLDILAPMLNKLGYDTIRYNATYEDFTDTNFYLNLTAVK